LKNITIRYNDEVGGDSAGISLTELSFGFREIDLDNSRFSLSHFQLDGLRAHVVRTKEKEPVETEAGEPPVLDLSSGLIGLSTIDVRYENIVSGDLIHLDLQSLQIKEVTFSSPSNEIGIAALQLTPTSFVYRSPTETENGTTHDGFDFNDIQITGFTLDLEDIHFSGETGGAKINLIGFREKSGFVLEQLSAEITIDDTFARIDDLIVRTGASDVSASFSAIYSSLERAREEPGAVRIDLSLDESLLGFSDALIFQPGLADQFRFGNNQGIAIAVSVNGTVDDLTVGRFEANMPESTRLIAYGRITGLPDIESAIFDLTLEEITTGRDDIVRLFAGEMLPDNIIIPGSIHLSGRYKGSLKEFETSIDVRTSIGQLVAAITMDMREDEERYNGTVTVDNFDLGALLDQTEQLGSVSLTASIDGSGFDIEVMDAYLDATIARAHLRGYDYKDVRIDGRVRNRRFTGFAGMDDPNLDFRFNGDVQLTEDEPVFAFEFDLRHADLYALGFTDTETAIRVSVNADFVGASVETIDGTVIIRDVLITQEQDRYPIDSLVVTAIAVPGHSKLTVMSDFISAEYEGNVTIADLPSVVMNHVNRYFELHHVDDDTKMAGSYFNFTIALQKTDLFSDVVLPDLHELSSAIIEGGYTWEDRNLSVLIDIPVIKYGSYELDSLRVKVESNPEQIQYDIRSTRFEMPSMKITAPEIYGTIQRNTISTNLALYNDELETIFAIGTLFESKDTVYTVTLLPGEFVLMYDNWNVPDDNYIRFGGNRFYVYNLQLERNSSRIITRSRDNGTLAPPVEITMQDFDISGLPRLIGNDDLALGGYVNGRIVLSDILSELKMNVDMLLSDFSFGGSDVGNIALRLQQDTPGRYDLEAELSKQDNQASITGYIVTTEEDDEINLSVDIRNLNLAAFEGFAMEQLVDLSGSVIGTVSVTGHTSAPDVNGSLTFRDASFLVVQLNTRFRLENEQIAFERNGLSFRDVTIRDASNNRAVIDGTILIQDFMNYRFALNIRSNNFVLMQTDRLHNDVFYGRIIIDSDIRIRGDQNLPVINASIGFKEGTNLTIVVPEQDPEVIERAGIVEFVEMDESHQPIRDLDDSPDTVRTAIQGIDLTANIDVNPQTAIRVIIDEQAGDYLQIRGGGMLSLGVDPSGLLSIAGRYEVTDGAYQMTFYEVARRRFELRPGSYILWSGDPMDAEVDMSAIYTVRTTAIDLVADQVGDEARQQYRRALPFQVFLNMRGNLLSPDISFQIDMPEEQRSAFGGVVYQQVQQINQNETERNKQVFALLVLNRFLAENPFDMGEGAGLTGAARSSASRLLTQQLNTLSGRYIRGIDIRFDVESYEEFTEQGPAGRTELQVQVSRRFLDDRLVIEVGGQIDLEGEHARQTEISDIAGDVAVEYLLTEDGRFRIRGFRKTEYSTLGEGELILTGISLVFSREFNRFIDMFRRDRDSQSVLDPETVERK
jgi:translocation and assembly module TamB